MIPLHFVRYLSSALFTALTWLVLCWFFPATATADDLSAEEMERLEVHISAAAEATDQGDYHRAVEEWTAAAEIVDHPRIRLHLGNSLAEIDECSKAQEIYEELGRRGDLDGEMRAEHRDLGRQLELCEEPGEVYFECTPDDLHLEIDDQKWSCAEWRDVEPGHYRGTATRDGFEADDIEFRVDDGERIQRAVVLRQPVEVDDGTDPLLVAGVGTAGLGGLLLGVGAIRDSRTTERADEMVAAREDGDRARMNELRDEASSAKRITILSYGVGAAALAAGTGLTLYSLTHSDAEDEPLVDIGVGARNVMLNVRF